MVNKNYLGESLRKGKGGGSGRSFFYISLLNLFMHVLTLITVPGAYCLDTDPDGHWVLLIR